MSHRASIYTGFAAVYVIWGSTYLAIGKTVEEVPPVFLVAVRGLLAGAVLYGWVRWRGALAVRGGEIVRTIPTAVLLFGGGYVLVAWAEQWVPSGAAALLNATTPGWVVLFEWVTRRRPRPTLRFAVAIGLGLGGVALLARGDGEGALPLLPTLALVLASAAWAAGTLRARNSANGDPLRASAVQLLTGGFLLLPLSLMVGEGAAIASGFSMSSLLALAYLIVFGSLIGFSAYVWLLHHVSASRVSSHAYVNPLIAVLVGSLIGGERIHAATLIAAALILVSVFFIVRERTIPVSRQDVVESPERSRMAA